ncbi:MAG: hypothetical protein KA285_08490 [Bacteroidia bacterium]|nr:hypothetical protein [Bacteroidia bacterium]MBP6533310.1 hypothetical protein [Bacteroidia bacterium]
MYRYLILFLCLSISISCKDNGCDDDGQLTDSELSWMPYYNGQMLVFENDSLGTDTFIVNVKRFDYDFYCPTSECNKSEAIQAKFDLDSVEFLLSIAHPIGCPKGEDGTVVYWGGRRDFIKERNDNLTLVINGVTYSNVRLLIENTNLTGRGNVYYSKTKGILSYQINDSITWTLAN